ncbi:hypothetical protein BD769DRAFT_1390627 [Suillus cothurnatus]|nr:hypothetical protein BD769DRAFT_1390627 [Suillus cothurnatus]
MSVTVNEMLDIFGGEGAMIFNRPHHGPNLFHVVSCATIKESCSCCGEPEPVIKVLVVTEHVHLYPDLLIVHAIAHDGEIQSVCTQTEGLAEFLACQATLLCSCQFPPISEPWY